MVAKHILTVILVVTLVGCAPKRQDRSQFQPTHPVAVWSDILPGETPALQDGFVLLTGGPTEAVFPVSLAVARVKVVDTECVTPGGGESTGHALELDVLPKVDMLRWNSAFDDVRPVSEVFPLSRIAMNGTRVNLSNLMAASRAMTGRLCLVYSPTHLTESETEIRGVLYQLEGTRALAAIHARAVVHLYDGETGELLDIETEPGVPVATPHVAAERRFRELVRAAILELIANDEPGTPMPEDGWVPQGPLEPRIWPPIPYDAPDPYRRRQ